MFDWFNQRTVVKQVPQQPRGMLPTYVTSESIVLCKGSSTVRNTYEIRLALFMAVQQRLKFILAIRSGVQVESGLREHLQRHGGRVQEGAIDEYSISLGHTTRTGEEGDCWVLGDSEAHRRLLLAIDSEWLRERLDLNSIIVAEQSPQFEAALRSETFEATNLDGENVGNALAALCRELKSLGGFLFVQ